MNVLAKLDQLDLHTATQAEMAAVIQSLIAQVQHDAKAIQAKDIKEGSRYFCERLFWASEPKQSAKT